VTNYFQNQFVDAAGGDYTVQTGSILGRAASDGSDIGVDFPALRDAVDGVTSGKPRGAGTPAVPPTAALTVSCTDLVCIFEDTSLPGSGGIASRSWSFGDGSAADNGPASGTHRFAAAGTYEVSIAVKDAQGLSATASTAVDVTQHVHAAYSGTTRKWSNSSGTTNYWSADVTVTLHSLDEQPIAGATVTATWSGAVTKTVTGVTDATCRCVLKSGTLSYGRSKVSLNLTAAAAPNIVYDPAANHDATGSMPTLTLIRP
jgi:PKD repeat protein